jgi:lysophospholipase L1-like esterase
MPATGVSGVDLYAKAKDGPWRFVGNGRPTAMTNTATFPPPAGADLLLYLPPYNGIKSIEIGIPPGRTISTPDAAALKQRKTIVFYGTSITQGGCASRPGMNSTAIAGRKLDATIINLGFSGAGRMEPEMADLLAELNPTVYLLDCLWNMGPADVSERIEPFVKKLRAAHPDTPIVLAEDSSVRGLSPTPKGRILRDAYEKMAKEGVKNLHFLWNEGMVGDDGEGTVDGVHLTDLGMMRQADVFTKALRPLLQ